MAVCYCAALAGRCLRGVSVAAFRGVEGFYVLLGLTLRAWALASRCCHGLLCAIAECTSSGWCFVSGRRCCMPGTGLFGAQVGCAAWPAGASLYLC